MRKYLKFCTATILLLLLYGNVFCAIYQTQKTNKYSNHLIIDFSLKYVETSKDSDRRIYEISTTNSYLFFRELRSARLGGGKMDEDKKMKLNSKIIEDITQFIVSNQLNIELAEIQETGGIGMSVFLDFKVTGLVSVNIQIEGKSNIWGSDEYVAKNWGNQYVGSRTNIKNTKIITQADRFVSFIKDLLRTKGK